MLENIPSNFSLKFDFLTSLQTFPKVSTKHKEIWEKEGAFETYLLLNSEKSVIKVAEGIVSLGKKTGAFDEK